MACGAKPPGRAELERHYAPAWLREVPVAAILEALASVVAAATSLEGEPCRRSDEVRTLLHLSDGGTMRLRCAVDDGPPHGIMFPAPEPSDGARCLSRRRRRAR